MAAINLGIMSFSPEEVRDINELIIQDILEAPDLNLFHTIVPNVKTSRYIGMLGEGGLIGVAGMGKTKVAQDWAANAIQAELVPKKWEIFLEEFVDDVENSMVTYSLDSGTKYEDLTGTDYMAIVVGLIAKSIKKFIWRLVWFNEVDAENYIPAVGETPASGGILTPGVPKKYFTIIDGVFKQLADAIISNPKRHVQIDANLESTVDLQMSAMTGDMAVDVLSKMFKAIPFIMRNPAKLLICCTQSVADAYQSYLEGMKLPATYTNLVEGVQALKFRGYNIIPVPIWDEIIQQNYINGDKLYNPHRVVMIEKANNIVGIKGAQLMTDLKIWYSDDLFCNRIYASDFVDAKIIDKDRLAYAI